jgi:sigma-E factor negative regulatory protein RseC
MLIETGRVVAIEQDGLWVETIRQSTCGSCVAQKGCGHSLIQRVSDGRRSLIRVLPGQLALEDCAVDDEVSISIPEEVILRGSMVVYLFPLFCMLAGAMLAVNLWQGSQDLVAAAGAVAGFGLGVAGIRLHAWHHRHDQRLQPTLVGIRRSNAIYAGPG